MRGKRYKIWKRSLDDIWEGRHSTLVNVRRTISAPKWWLAFDLPVWSRRQTHGAVHRRVVHLLVYAGLFRQAGIDVNGRPLSSPAMPCPCREKISEKRKRFCFPFRTLCGTNNHFEWSAGKYKFPRHRKPGPPGPAVSNVSNGEAHRAPCSSSCPGAVWDRILAFVCRSMLARSEQVSTLQSVSHRKTDE